MYSFTSTTSGLRIYGPNRRPIKFRGGRFQTDDADLAQVVRDFGATRPQYAITETTEAEEPTFSEDAYSSEALEAMTAAELQELARQRDLKVTGNKAALVERILAAQEE